ncbi:hydrogen peroxide-inducible genes activator [Methylocystis sp. MJC1]|jgi:LysR family hydrogen peroxide-inducible transcriptional activator|uniref:hydrogen peroxide-inducible genes activator n=1 Tax=Methylocystis sp. MJC1 TaxID=2654282 RepID=UPI0013EBF8F0|nr:hydrogen peroxide-inducible genes activator [Methylocystis sp. MJC1]KAF2991739.1 Hydrogen peroxide-inducible genes activator [Methylocystis sp. MJC1]MBU6527022.1 LysR family transcriptional regulator [Methylocystis sp. MJC1]UZX13460.1 hydrogen peroxide-inducible genes activator [Methylocystis sp. MJC1]
MKNLPTLRQLKFFVAVVDRLHFGKAAEACFVGQSALSAAIQELEETLGVALLERTRRSVVPTTIGLEIATRARALLRDAEDIVDIAAGAQDPTSGPLRLGVIPTIGPFLIPEVMPRLRAAFPGLRVYLREEQTKPILAQLESGQLDVAVIALPYQVEDVETLEIAEDPFFMVCPRGHRLDGRASACASDLEQEELLLLEDGHCMRDHALAVCALAGARRNIAFQGTSLQTLAQMVAGGLGITLAPRLAIEAGLLRGLDVCVAPIEGDRPARRIALAWRRTSWRKETFRLLAASLAESRFFSRSVDLAAATSDKD